MNPFRLNVPLELRKRNGSGAKLTIYSSGTCSNGVSSAEAECLSVAGNHTGGSKVT